MFFSRNLCTSPVRTIFAFNAVTMQYHMSLELLYFILLFSYFIKATKGITTHINRIYDFLSIVILRMAFRYYMKNQ